MTFGRLFTSSFIAIFNIKNNYLYIIICYYEIKIYFHILYFIKYNYIFNGDWGLGIGDWGLGSGGLGQ